MIRIVVDSSSDYPIDQLRQKNMEIIPISISLGEKTYIDGVDLKLDNLYKIIDETGDFPKTSQPSPQAFLDLFKDAKEKGDSVICILLSSELSGTCQTAFLARQMADYENIFIIDSLSATFTIKVMADYACRLRSEGASAPEIAKKVEALKSRVRVIAALDTLEYLSRGGRISKAAAAIGDMANIKPIITLTADGKIGILGKCLGKNKAIRFILKQLELLEIDTDFPLYSIYSFGTNNCRHFEEMLSSQGIRRDDRLQIGATIGSHIGPEAFGIIFVTRS